MSSARAQALIRSVSGQIERLLQRSLGWGRNTTTSPELHKGGDYRLYLVRYPVTAVERVLDQESGQDITDWVDFQDLLDEGILFRPAGWPARYRRAHRLTGRPIVESVDYSLAVAYSGGYVLPEFDRATDATHNPTGAQTNLPPEIEEAV